MYGDPKTLNAVLGPLGLVRRIVALSCSRYVIFGLFFSRVMHASTSSGDRVWDSWIEAPFVV